MVGPKGLCKLEETLSEREGHLRCLVWVGSVWVGTIGTGVGGSVAAVGGLVVGVGRVGGVARVGWGGVAGVSWGGVGSHGWGDVSSWGGGVGSHGWGGSVSGVGGVGWVSVATVGSWVAVGVACGVKRDSALVYFMQNIV